MLLPLPVQDAHRKTIKLNQQSPDSWLVRDLHVLSNDAAHDVSKSSILVDCRAQSMVRGDCKAGSIPVLCTS